MARIPSDLTDRLSDMLNRTEDSHRRSEATQPDRPPQLSAIIQGVSGASVAEIDRLIAELHSLREELVNEGQRIQRELIEYSRLNQGAIESTKIIADTLMKMKTERSPPIQS
jgi:hypothetical protein